MSTEPNKDLPPPYPGPGQQQPYPPPQQGYPPPQQAYPPPNQTTVYAVQPAPVQTATATTVVVAGRGNCPNCRVGTLVEEFTCCGIVLAILFFPIGLLCCLLMRVRVCSHCHATF